jgi:CrcB protein
MNSGDAVTGQLIDEIAVSTWDILYDDSLAHDGAPDEMSGNYRRLQPMSLLNSIAAISAGAALGALARWILGLGLNGLFPGIPPGTLLANLLGGYLIGIAIVIISAGDSWSPEWRLFVITGFLGGLTTFSAFSAEVAVLLQQGRMLLAAAAISLHVIGSISMTLLGMASVSAIRALR